jgi:hypothetical protein
VTGEKRSDELTDEELDAQIGAALPDREALSAMPLPDPMGGDEIAAQHVDSDYEPEPNDVGSNSAD